MGSSYSSLWWLYNSKTTKKCLKNNMEYNKGLKECIIIKYNCKEGMKNI